MQSHSDEDSDLDFDFSLKQPLKISSPTNLDMQISLNLEEEIETGSQEMDVFGSLATGAISSKSFLLQSRLNPTLNLNLNLDLGSDESEEQDQESSLSYAHVSPSQKYGGSSFHAERSMEMGRYASDSTLLPTSVHDLIQSPSLGIASMMRKSAHDIQASVETRAEKQQVQYRRPGFIPLCQNVDEKILQDILSRSKDGSVKTIQPFSSVAENAKSDIVVSTVRIDKRVNDDRGQQNEEPGFKDTISKGFDPIILIDPLEKEVYWLMNDYIPSTFAKIGSDLEIASSALQCLIPKNAVPWGAEGPKETDEGYHRLPSEKANGYIFFDGESRIVQADISVRHPSAKPGVYFRTQILPQKPYEITQLHNTKRMIKSIDNEFDLDHYVGASRSMEEFLHFFQMLGQVLRRAVDELVLPSPHAFPNSTPKDISMFKPALPSEIIIQFGVQERAFYVDIITIAASSAEKAKGKKPTKPLLSETLDLTGKAVLYQNRIYDVVSHVRIQLQVERIRIAYHHLSLAYRRCLDSIDKLTYLQSVLTLAQSKST
eukprot:TRINITY_DN7591_c0_g1_i2.p1 TRINITY_DN7591_c0_g1~~TRINITY_DN7591_c0_g1_i2.p1  ORF type:complete len:544 (-),score=113.33 TRINITY_DN7591_c0_g1_i2:321-1952(-)